MIFGVMRGMVIISYKIFVCMDILGASCSGAFSIWSYCRVCENPFYGVFMFGLCGIILYTSRSVNYQQYYIR